MVKKVTVEKPLIALGLTLGEGCVWVRPATSKAE